MDTNQLQYVNIDSRLIRDLWAALREHNTVDQSHLTIALDTIRYNKEKYNDIDFEMVADTLNVLQHLVLLELDVFDYPVFVSIMSDFLFDMFDIIMPDMRQTSAVMRNMDGGSLNEMGNVLYSLSLSALHEIKHQDPNTITKEIEFLKMMLSYSSTFATVLVDGEYPHVDTMLSDAPVVLHGTLTLH